MPIMAIVEGANGLWWWTIGDMEGGLVIPMAILGQLHATI